MDPASAQAKVLRARNVLLQSPHLGNHLGGSYSLVRSPAEPFSRPGRSIRAPSRGAAVKAGRPSGGHSKSLALMAASTAARSCGTGETCKEWLGRHPYTDHTHKNKRLCRICRRSHGVISRKLRRRVAMATARAHRSGLSSVGARQQFNLAPKQFYTTLHARNRLGKRGKEVPFPSSTAWQISVDQSRSKVLYPLSDLSKTHTGACAFCYCWLHFLSTPRVNSRERQGRKIVLCAASAPAFLHGQIHFLTSGC